METAEIMVGGQTFSSARKSNRLLFNIFLLFLVLPVISCTTYSSVAIDVATKGKETRNLSIYISEKIEGINLDGAYVPILLLHEKPDDLIKDRFDKFIHKVFATGNQSRYDAKLVISVDKLEISTPTVVKNQHINWENLFDYYVLCKSTISIRYKLIDKHGNLFFSGNKKQTSEKRHGFNNKNQKEYSVETIKYWAVRQNLNDILIEIVSDIYNNNSVIAFEQKIKENNTSPSDLVITSLFTDNRSFLANSAIDAGEQSQITSTVKNEGSGIAFAVILDAKSTNNNVKYQTSFTIGDIPPGERKEIKIPITADLSLASGTASFLISAHEKRGYDAQPVELQIPTRSLQAPQLALASCSSSDSTAGLADGDGDNVLENNETIELAPFINNTGVGSGIGVKVVLADLAKGLEVVKGEDDLGSIAPGATGRGTLAFRIPRTYAGQKIVYRVVATDARGMKTERDYSFSFHPQTPVLSYTYQLVDNSNRQVPSLENGGTYVLTVVPRNQGDNSATSVSVSAVAESGAVSIGDFRASIGSIAAGGQGTAISIPVSLPRSYAEQTARIKLTLNQKDFPAFSDTISMPVTTRKPALLQDVALLNGVGAGFVSQNSWPRFRVSVSNNGNLDAENVKVVFTSTRKDAQYQREEFLGTIRAGESQYKDFTFFVRGNASTGDLPLSVQVEQEDFGDLEEAISFQVTRQTAIVQKVEPVGGTAVAIGTPMNTPPEIYVGSLEQNSETYKETAILSGSVLSYGPGNGIDHLEVLLNGKPLQIIPLSEKMRLDRNIMSKISAEGNKVVFNGEIALRPGENAITIRSKDRNNLSVEKVLRIVKKAKLGNIYAVVVGISDFADPAYNLQYAASDARKFSDFLRSEAGGNIPDKRIRLLTDSMANRASLIEAMTNFLGTAAKEDTVEIYLATHGVIDPDGAFYFLTHNGDVNNLRGTAFSNSDFIDIIANKIHAGRILIYLDVCHAGMSDLSEKLYASRGVGVYEVNGKISDLAVAMSNTNTGVKTFSASSANGSSLETRELAGGIFTNCLLNGLGGAANEDQDEWVNIGELNRYLMRTVLMDSNGKQMPSIKGTLSDETPIAKVR